jgi:predicted signal transduction protein with EAL and GGDEF domain
VLLEHPVSPQSLHAAAQRFQEAMDAPFEASGRPLLLTTSIGISRYPQDGSDEAELLAGAERALVRARKTGLGCHDFLDKGLIGRLEEEEVLQHQLQEALLSPEDHFHLVYQPIISVDQETCLGLESLVRRIHPDKGVLYPHDFLPEASVLGL